MEINYSATVSDHDTCDISETSGYDECEADVSFEGGNQHVTRSFSGTVSAEIKLGDAAGPHSSGLGTDDLRESKVSATAANTFSHTMNGTGTCFDIAGTASETSTGTNTAGQVVVDRLTPTTDANGNTTDIDLALNPDAGNGPGEHVNVTDNITDGGPNDCQGTFTNNYVESFAQADLGLFDYERHIYNGRDDVYRHWKMNPQWRPGTKGIVATKMLQGSVRFEAPDSGTIHVRELLQIKAIDPAIICFVTAAHPHKSTHDRGHIKAQAIVKCDRKVQWISIRATLRRDGRSVGTNEATKRDTDNFHLSAMGRCPGRAAHYVGKAGASVRLPDGYIPRVLTGIDTSRKIRIDC